MSAGGPGRREVAQRLFAVEYDAATHSFRSGEEERAPVYVVSPTGALINRLFVVGVLTESTWVNEETVRARIADPTGGFVVYAGQYQQDARGRLSDLSSPAFVSITGKANVFEPDDSDTVWTSIRPEAVAEVDAAVRDRWIVETARRTIDRIGLLAAAIDDDASTGSDGVRRAREAYAPTPAYLATLFERCVGALEVVTGERPSLEEGSLSPDMSGEPTVTLEQLASLSQERSSADAVDHPATPDPEPPSDEDAAGTGHTEEPAVADADASDTVRTDAPADPAEASPDEEVIDPDEREAIESEFGTDFSSGTEIPSPEESDQPAPDSPDAEPSEDAASGSEDADTAEETAEDLVDVVMAAMAELGDGSGVPRDALIEHVVEDHEATPDEVRSAITDALMEGRCYEPGDDHVQPI